MNKEKKFTVFIAAGESSADRCAAELVKTASKKDPTVHFTGLASEYSKKAGMTVLLDISNYSTVGFVESLPFILPLLKAYFKIKRYLKQIQPDLFIPIDNQGFNMLCVKAAKSLGIPVYYYIAPQEWHWGTEKGGEKVLESVDKILAIFPQEAQFYKQLGGDAVYVGHPVMERVKPFMKVGKKDAILSIFPGSREQEIRRLLPLFLEVGQRFCKAHNLGMHVSIANPHYEDLIKDIIAKSPYGQQVLCERGNSLDLMSRSQLSLVASGTVSLEHALLSVPHVVAYKLSAGTNFILNTFMKRIKERVTYMSMANSLLKQEVFPEFFQHKATAEALYKGLTQMLEKQDSVKQQCQKLVEQLDKGAVSERLFDEIKQLKDSTRAVFK